MAVVRTVTPVRIGKEDYMDEPAKNYPALRRHLKRNVRKAYRWLARPGVPTNPETQTAATGRAPRPQVSGVMGQEERDALRRKHRNGNVNLRPLCDYCDYDGKPVEYPCDAIKALDALDALEAQLSTRQ